MEAVMETFVKVGTSYNSKINKMTNYINDFSIEENLWGHKDMLELDLEHMEFNSNFDSHEAEYHSIIDEKQPYQSFLSFFGKTEDVVYNTDEEEDSQGDNNLEDHDSYLDTDRDDFYYFI